MNPKTEIKIFIGYAREDQLYADQIYTFLNGLNGVVPWMDQYNLLPGSNWEEEIMTAIKESRFVLMLLSSRSVNKEGYVQKEAQEILDRLKYFPPGEIFIIPARIDYCTPRYQALKKLHYVDLFEQSTTSNLSKIGIVNGLKKIQTLITFEQNKLINQNTQAMIEKQTMDREAHIEKATRIKNQLSEDLLSNLAQYSQWLHYQEYLPTRGEYDQVIRGLPNWTKQANGEWLEELLTWEVLKVKDGRMIFTPLGIELLEAVK